MKKIFKTILIFIIIFMTKNVYAESVSVSIICPSKASPNSIVDCTIGTNIFDSLKTLKEIKGEFLLENAIYSNFYDLTNFTGEVNSKGFNLTNINKNTDYLEIGTLKIKIGQSGPVTIGIKNITANDKSISNATTNIEIVETMANSQNNENTNEFAISKTTKSATNDAFIDNLTITDHKFNFDKEYYIYKVNVDSNVNNIEIVSTYDKSNINVVGDGVKNLNYGPNVFKIIATSKNGYTNTYTLTVNRKGTNIVSNNNDDIKLAIESYDDITVNIDSKDTNKIATREILNLIKNTNKKITYNINEEKKLLYSFTFDGKKINNIEKEVNLQIDFNKNNKETVKKYFNENNFYILNINSNETFPDGTLIKVNVNKKFNNDKLYLFNLSEDSKKLELKNQDLKIINGYVTFGLLHGSDYVLSDINILDKSSNAVALIIALFIIAFELFGISFLIRKNNVNKKKK